MPRREHESRLREAHRRRRPQGLDARGALWFVVLPKSLQRQVGLQSYLRPHSVEPFRFRAIMEIRTRGANRLHGLAWPTKLSA
jgi:hypothetical protein